MRRFVRPTKSTAHYYGQASVCAMFNPCRHVHAEPAQNEALDNVIHSIDALLKTPNQEPQTDA